MADIENLVKRLEIDEVFRNNLENSKSSDDFKNKLKSAGFDLQPEDFVSMVKTKVEQDEGILSDDDLNSVSGGYEIKTAVLIPEEMKNWTSDVWKAVMDIFIS